jgi:hypothetical protein
VPDLPEPAVTAAVRALRGHPWPDGEVTEAQIATLVLEAAAPVLAETVAQKITEHMETFGPRRPAGALEPVTGAGRAYQTWHRHFGIAARIAAGAFDTREDQLRKAAEAIARGDYVACNPPEVPDGR